MPAKAPTGKVVSQSDLCKELATKLGVSQADAARTLDTIQDTIVGFLQKGDGVALRIGRFKRADRKARNGLNPQTQEKMKFPAAKAVKFSSSQKLKDALN